MAWALQFDGANDWLALASDISLSDFLLSIENFKIDATTASGEFQAVTGSLLSYENFISARDTHWQIRISNNNYTIPYSTVPEPTTSATLIVSRVGDQLTLSHGGVGTTIAVTTSTFVIGCFGVINNAWPVAIHLLGGHLGNVTLGSSHYWDFDNADHSGSTDQPILTDTVGGNDATGVNFPSFDPSVWVDLGGGGFELTPESGSFSYSGGIASLIADRVVIPETASYSYSGDAVSALFNRSLSVDGGSFNYSGGDAGLAFDRLVAPEQGLFTYTGGSVSVLLSRVITPETGSFSYAGGDVDLVYNQIGSYILTPESGSFSYSGGDVQLLVDRLIQPETGGFTYSGNDAGLLFDRVATPQTGDYTYSGGDVSQLYARQLTPVGGMFSYTGNPVQLIYSNAVIRLISTYTIQYALDAVTADFNNKPVNASFADIGITARYTEVG